MLEVLCSKFETGDTTMKPYEKYLKLINCGPWLALIGTLLGGPPQSLAQSSGSRLSEPLRLTVAPRTSSRIAMKTLPKAICALHVAGDSDILRSFKLFSDDDGMIRFNVTPSEERDQVAAYAVDCTSDGLSRTFGLELRANSIPTSDMPAPAADIRTPKAGDVIRPALTEADALQLSDEEVVRREYPVRPDPTKAPDAFAQWLQVVSKPARRLNPRQVAHPEASASTYISSGTWSGFDLKTVGSGSIQIPVSTYDFVASGWAVPTVSLSKIEQNTTTKSSFWIGLDGDNDICPYYCPNSGNQSDLWQAGTEQDVTNYHWGPWGIFSDTFSTYNVWSQFPPAQSSEQVMAGFNVSPGDIMYAQVYVANAGGSPSLSGYYATAIVEDMTKGEYEWVYNPVGLNTILGYQAEWIMERTTNTATDSPADLADYGQAFMYNPYAMTTGGAYASYNGANSDALYMYNSSTSDMLSMPFVWDSNTIEYIWYNFH
jgi:Peptidase A4 family